MVVMRCVRDVQTFEGILCVGDDFAVGYRHERRDGKLVQTVKMPWISAATRAIELRKLGIAVAVELPCTDVIQPIVQSYFQESTPPSDNSSEWVDTSASIKRRKRK